MQEGFDSLVVAGFEDSEALSGVKGAASGS